MGGVASISIFYTHPRGGGRADPDRQGGERKKRSTGPGPVVLAETLVRAGLQLSLGEALLPKVENPKAVPLCLFSWLTLWDTCIQQREPQNQAGPSGEKRRDGVVEADSNRPCAVPKEAAQGREEGGFQPILFFFFSVVGPLKKGLTRFCLYYRLARPFGRGPNHSLRPLREGPWISIYLGSVASLLAHLPTCWAC